jgi:hypothetical protein
MTYFKQCVELNSYLIMYFSMYINEFNERHEHFKKFSHMPSYLYEGTSCVALPNSLCATFVRVALNCCSLNIRVGISC